MSCKNYEVNPHGPGGTCSKSGIIDHYERPHDMMMFCEFNGNAQECLDNLKEINNWDVTWRDYAIVRIKQTNPNALSFEQDLEDERKHKPARQRRVK